MTQITAPFDADYVMKQVRHNHEYYAVVSSNLPNDGADALEIICILWILYLQNTIFHTIFVAYNVAHLIKKAKLIRACHHFLSMSLHCIV